MPPRSVAPPEALGIGLAFIRLAPMAYGRAMDDVALDELEAKTHAIKQSLALTCEMSPRFVSSPNTTNIRSRNTKPQPGSRTLPHASCRDGGVKNLYKGNPLSTRS